MAVFDAMEVPWQEPVTSVLELALILNFDLDILKAPASVGQHTGGRLGA